MEYTVNQLAKISNVSKRTLRYFDQIGLLSPKRIASNGYRLYGQNEVDLLQQILFYRELGIPLEEIRKIIYALDYNRVDALKSHLSALVLRKNNIELLINNVKKTIKTLKGEINMTDNEKFEGFKQKYIDENEQVYGEEIRKKYGHDAIDNSNKKYLNMSKEQYEKTEELSNEIKETLKAAFKTKDPSGKLAQKVCELHKEWLCHYWQEATYSKEAHKALAQMYCQDERFKAYYDSIEKGCAEFLRDAIKIYCK